MEKEVQNDQLHPEATAHIVSSQNLKHITSEVDIQTPKKPRRKFHIPKIAILIGFFIVLLVLMEGGLYLAKQSKNNTSLHPTPLPMTQVSPTPDPTADWQIYEGDEYSFMYPPDWSIDSSKPTNIIIGPVSTINHIGATVPEYVSPLITLTTTISTPNTDLVKFSKITTNSSPIWSDIQVDNLIGKQARHIGCASGECRDIYFQKDRIIYNFTEQNNLEELNQIISTFKFTDPALSCTPRPTCLDSNPRCLIPETDDMCPSSSSKQTDVLITPPPGANTGETMIACTMEAKLCPDGKTYVSRQGPKCEFEKCPSE